MKLTVMERLLALGVIDGLRGNIAMLRVCQEIVGKVGLSAKENAFYEVKRQPDGSTTWRQDKLQVVDIKIESAEVEIVAEGLQQMSATKTLTPQHLTLYDKFVKEEK